MYFISVFKCYFLIPHHWSLPAVLTVPDFPSYFTLVLGSQGSCGEIGLPHWVWCRKQDFQVVAPRSLTWQDRLSPPWEIPPLTLPSGPQAGCCPLQVLHPAVSQPAGGGGGSGWSFQMLHPCLDCWHCSSTLNVGAWVHDLRLIVLVWLQDVLLSPVLIWTL